MKFAISEDYKSFEVDGFPEDLSSLEKKEIIEKCMENFQALCINRNDLERDMFARTKDQERNQVISDTIGKFIDIINNIVADGGDPEAIKRFSEMTKQLSGRVPGGFGNFAQQMRQQGEPDLTKEQMETAQDINQRAEEFRNSEEYKNDTEVIDGEQMVIDILKESLKTDANMSDDEIKFIISQEEFNQKIKSVLNVLIGQKKSETKYVIQQVVQMLVSQYGQAKGQSIKETE